MCPDPPTVPPDPLMLLYRVTHGKRSGLGITFTFKAHEWSDKINKISDSHNEN